MSCHRVLQLRRNPKPRRLHLPVHLRLANRRARPRWRSGSYCLDQNFRTPLSPGPFRGLGVQGLGFRGQRLAAPPGFRSCESSLLMQNCLGFRAWGQKAHENFPKSPVPLNLGLFLSRSSGHGGSHVREPEPEVENAQRHTDPKLPRYPAFPRLQNPLMKEYVRHLSYRGICIKIKGLCLNSGVLESLDIQS